MQHSIVARASSPAVGAERTRFRVPLGRAVSAILLVAVLSTAGAVHLIWQRTATRNVEQIVASLELRSANAVRSDLEATLALVASTAEIIRSILFQGAIKPDDEVKREFLFLSLLREQPAIAWIGFGFPDGRFFGSHATADGSIEMIEIGQAGPGELRPFRRDVYRPIPGDIFFERRELGATHYIVQGAPWFRNGSASAAPVWTVADILPDGFEPSIVISKKVEAFGRPLGAVMVAVTLTRLSQALERQDIVKGSKAFVLDRDGLVLATSEPADGAMAAHLSDFPPGDGLAAAVAGAVGRESSASFRSLVEAPALGPVFVSSSELPFEAWRLVTAVPRSVFAAEIDRSTRQVLIVIASMAMLTALSVVVLAAFLFTRPIARLAAQLKTVERFAFDDVRQVGSFLSELDDFSLALKRMAAGLGAFARYMPLDVVRPLVEGSFDPKPGGELREITVLFADLPSFTELTERLGPGVEPHLTSFLTIAVAAIHAEGGTVDKFIGDEVMAIWNAPAFIDDHALRACRAAAAIRRAMHAMPAISPERDRIRVRIGVNTGKALVGNIGSEERLSYTAIGDTVNLASRLVGIAKEKDVEIVVSGMTAASAGEMLPLVPLGSVTVRGKSVPVAIHTLTD